MIAVAVIAQSPAVRAGLRVLLAADAELEVVGDGATLDLIGRAPFAAADVLVVHGVPSLPQPLPDRLRGVLFVIDEWEPGASPPSGSFAWGVLPSDAAADELVAAARSLYNGLIVVHPTVAAYLIATAAVQAVGEREPLVEALTSREREVLQLLGQGLANKMIADQLHISEHTVKFHVSAIYAKLGVASRTEAVRAGARRGLIVL